MQEKKDNHSYDDIISLPHPTSKNHPRMTAIDRAAQFSPFAALTGYDAAVKETARLTDRRIELDEYEKAELDGKLQIIRDHLDDDCEVEFTYFVPDERKDGGSYCTAVGFVKKMNDYERQVVMRDGRKIPFDEIVELNSEIFAILTSEIE